MVDLWTNLNLKSNIGAQRKITVDILLYFSETVSAILWGSDWVNLNLKVAELLIQKKSKFKIRKASKFVFSVEPFYIMMVWNEAT